jgi:ADP-ribosyl-[dinitrogen reductase] hydrolase
MEYARRSSKTTHPNGMRIEACEVWTGAIVQIMQETSGTREGMKRFSKLDLLAYFSSFIYTNAKLRDALALPSDAPPPPTTDPELEEYYRVYHPLLHLISETQPQTPQSINPTIPPAQALPSTGYVLHTLTAALYCFLATQTFEEGAIMAVNLGDDADTVGAVYAGLAGCWYANDGTGDDVFWSPRVREWRKNLVRRDLVEEVADELVRFSEGLV